MEDEELFKLFIDIWSSTEELVRQGLSKHEFDALQAPATYQQTKNTISKENDRKNSQGGRAGPIILSLEALSLLSERFQHGLGVQLEPSSFWTLVRLASVVAIKSKRDTGLVILNEVFLDLKVLAEDCLQWDTRHTNSLREGRQRVLFTFGYMTKLMHRAVICLNGAEEGQLGQGKPDDPNYAELRAESAQTMIRIRKLTSNPDVCELDRSANVRRASPHPVGHAGQQRCLMTPSNSLESFFGRENTIRKIKDAIGYTDERCLKAILLRGDMGVGTSSVTMKYADELYREVELHNVLWVRAEGKSSVEDSFVEMASRLSLGCGSDARMAKGGVLDWLRSTDHRWLIVYDGVVKFRDIQAYWPPLGSSGQVIITSRESELLHGKNIDAAYIEVEHWTTEIGADFLLNFLRDPPFAPVDTDGALEISERLNALPLFLSTVGKQMKEMDVAIGEFVEILKAEAGFVLASNPWLQPLFERLDGTARRMMLIFSFCHEKDVPSELFMAEEHKRNDKVPSRLQFCKSKWSVLEAVSQLRPFMVRDRTRGNYGIRRVFQTSFKSFVSPPELEEAFHDTTWLLNSALRRRGTSQAQLYTRWHDCIPWIQHVTALQEGYKEVQQRSASFQATRMFCGLLNQCQRLLLELHYFKPLKNMTRCNLEAIRSIRKESTIDLKAEVLSHQGQMEARLGSSDRALQAASESHELREKDPIKSFREIVWAKHNIAQVYTTSGRLDEAEEWHSQAVKLWEWAAAQEFILRHENDIKKGEEVPAGVTLGLGRCFYFQDKLLDARNKVEEAIKAAQRQNDWAMEAFGRFTLGRIEMREKNPGEGKSCFTKAAERWQFGARTTAHQFYGACMYHLACWELDHGEISEARERIKLAMEISSMHQSEMDGEHIRNLYKWSEILRKSPGGEEEAAATLRELRELCSPASADGTEGSKSDPTDLFHADSFDKSVYCIWR